MTPHYSKSIFQKFYANAQTITQLVIHRDGNLMYYGYIRKLGGNQYIGLCVLLNDLMIKKIDGLFSLFEGAIFFMVENGYLINFETSGEIVPNANKLYLNQGELDLISERLRAGFSKLKANAIKLPPLTFGNSKDSLQSFNVDDDEEIVASSHSRGYTYIYKSRAFNVAKLNSYKGVLSRLSKQNRELKQEIEKLVTQIKKIKRQKKQFTFVIVLFVAILGCAFGLFVVNDNLSNAERELEESKLLNIQKDSVIGNRNAQIAETNARLAAIAAQKETLSQNYNELYSNILKNQPFIVKKCQRRGKTFTIDYYGIKQGSYNIVFNIIPEFGQPFTESQTLYVYKGDNLKSLTVDCLPPCLCVVLVKYEGRVIGGYDGASDSPYWAK